MAAYAAAPFEETVQYALENLTSGTSTAAMIDGARFTVMPVRTWKSVSGHYCRQFEVTLAKPASGADRAEGVRCRDGDGVWKRAIND
jgi:surface antigen